MISMTHTPTAEQIRTEAREHMALGIEAARAAIRFEARELVADLKVMLDRIESGELPHDHTFTARAGKIDATIATLRERTHALDLLEYSLRKLASLEPAPVVEITRQAPAPAPAAAPEAVTFESSEPEEAKRPALVAVDGGKPRTKGGRPAKLKATAIIFTGSESPEIAEGLTVSSWAEADQVLRQAAAKAPANGAYHKTWFDIEWSDGSRYSGRYDLKRGDLELANAGHELLARHVWQFVAFHAGFYQPEHMDAAAYADALEAYEKHHPGLKASMADLLKRAVIPYKA